MQYHKISDIFPLMTGEDFESLKRDIAEHGLRDPIIVHDNQIIDGRNRYGICVELGIEPRFVPWDRNGSLIDFVISKNLHRRHLNESQRAMVAARLAEYKHGGNRSKSQICDLVPQSEAGKMLNVGKRSVEHAYKVQSTGLPELSEKVDRGEIAVSTASVIAEAPEDEQEKIIQLSDKEILRKAKEIKERKQQERKQKRLEKIMQEKNPHEPSNDSRLDLGNCLEIIPTYPDNSIDVLLTDPPYGQAYVSNRREIENDVTVPIENDTPEKAFTLLDNMLTAIKPKLKTDAFVYIFTSWKTLCQIMEITSRHFGKVNTVLAWDKVNKTSGDLSIWGDAYEFIVFHKIGNRKVIERLSNVISNIPRLPFSDLHPTEKPVELMEYILQNSGFSGDTVADPFMGVGAVPLAAQKLCWNYYGVELVDRYFKITKRRMGI